MELNNFVVPVPFMGGSTSNEKAVFSDEFMQSITFISKIFPAIYTQK